MVTVGPLEVTLGSALFTVLSVLYRHRYSVGGSPVVGAAACSVTLVAVWLTHVGVPGGPGAWLGRSSSVMVTGTLTVSDTSPPEALMVTVAESSTASVSCKPVTVKA